MSFAIFCIRICLGLSLLLLISFTAPSKAPASDLHPPQAPYILGVFPFVPVASIEGIFAPLAGEISRATGRPVRLKVSSSFEKFMEELKARSFDIAFVQPFDYVEIARPGGYLPVAARNDKLASQIVVRQDSPIRSLTDLKGKKFGMPPKVSAVSFMNRVSIKKAGLRPDVDVQFVYLASHQACLQQLMIGNLAACGVSEAGVRMVEKQLKTTFRLIHESSELPTPLFVVKKELPRKDRDLIAAAIVATDLAGVSADLRQMFIGDTPKPFRPANDREYDVVRKQMKAVGAR